MNIVDYRRQALDVALDPSHKLHLLPNVPKHARKILDVGCHAGQILEALRLPDNCHAFGCDINIDALDLARQTLPAATFSPGRAEALPYEDSCFDFVFARGVVVAIDIPRSLRQFNRVLKINGKLWLSLYRWKDCRKILEGTLQEHPVKTIVLGAYAALNGAVFHYTGKIYRHPLNPSRIMSFQTETSMRKELEKAGFGGIKFSRGTYLVVEANKIDSLREGALTGIAA